MTFNLKNLFKSRFASEQRHEADAEAQFNEGLVLHQNGRLDQARTAYERVLAIQASHADAIHLLGVIAFQSRDNVRALAFIDKAIAIKSDQAAYHSNRGLALQALGRFDEALVSYERAISLSADFAEAYYNRGNVLSDLQRLDEALESYDRAITLKADFADAYCRRGTTFHALSRWGEALASYDQAIKIKADFALAYCNRGVTLHAANRLEEALASYDLAVKFNAEFAEAYCNRGVVLKALNRLEEALTSHGQAIRINPSYADACNNRGVVLQAMGRLDDAVTSYERAIGLRRDHVEACINRGNVLGDLKRLDESLASYELALMHKPDHEFLYGTFLHAKRKLCDWSGSRNETAELIGRIERNTKASSPFVVLTLTDSAPIQRRAAEIWVQGRYPASRALPPMKRLGKRGRIRVGYYSADFRNHPVCILMAGVFEAHDKSRFENVAFSYGPATGDAMRIRVERAFHRFIDVSGESDQAVAALSRNMGIDIAVDLGGATQNARTGIFAMRAAPLQLSYIGYLGTMGAEYIDYLIADKVIVPPQYQQYYAEKIIYLPSYQANDAKRVIADRHFSRAELGLPDSGFVFCCFSNNFKISPAVFDAWMRILKRVQGSVLLLYADNKWMVANLRKEAAARGVEPQRLIFAGHLPADEYLARYRVADLFLDTLPYNAGTTASDALWAGLPVLTCMGESFACRVAASILNAIGLPELVTTTYEQYEARAVALAENSEALNQIRQKLGRNRLTAPLFDTPLFTRRLEAAYTQIYERYHSDLPPEHLYVAS